MKAKNGFVFSLFLFLTAGMIKFIRLKTTSGLAKEALREHAGWMGLLVLNLIIVLSLRSNIISPQVSTWVPQLLLNLFLLVIYIYAQLKIKAAERYEFLQLVLRMLLFGAFVVCASFFTEAVFYLFSGQSFAQNIFLVNIVYLISLLLISAFLIILLVAFKRFILYEKSRVLLIAWRVFEYGLIGSMVLGVFNIRIDSALNNFFLIALAVMGLILSVNLKWVGYLDFKQKFRGLFMLLGVAACLAYFSFFIWWYGSQDSILLNLADNLFILALLGFCFFYCLLSCLVIFFNLPTSSVYEQKLREIKGFQKLNRTIRNEDSKEMLFRTLLENAMASSHADIGWVELKKEDGSGVGRLIAGDIQEQELSQIIKSIKKPSLRKLFETDFESTQNIEYYLGTLMHRVYRSMLIVPLSDQGECPGILVLVKDVEGAFNMDAIELVRTYVDQTCISVENIRLLKEALENERYQEEMAIARRVQRSLLPELPGPNEHFSLAVYSESADEAGGDYYDTYKINDHQYVLVIADVAGHGTSAAFNMAQLKGVFQSLVPLGFSCTEFVERANDALSKCLDKATFVTLTYIEIDTNRRCLKFVRAGHCPTLYFSAAEKKFLDFRNKGMGLGILRNGEFGKHLEENYVNYQPDDLLVLYTDGITECKNHEQEEFGPERLQQIIRKNAQKNVAEIQNCIVEEVRKFSGFVEIKDDFTTMIVKFS